MSAVCRLGFCPLKIKITQFPSLMDSVLMFCLNCLAVIKCDESLPNYDNLVHLTRNKNYNKFTIIIVVTEHEREYLIN